MCTTSSCGVLGEGGGPAYVLIKHPEKPSGFSSPLHPLWLRLCTLHWHRVVIELSLWVVTSYTSFLPNVRMLYPAGTWWPWNALRSSFAKTWFVQSRVSGSRSLTSSWCREGGRVLLPLGCRCRLLKRELQWQCEGEGLGELRWNYGGSCKFFPLIYVCFPKLCSSTCTIILYNTWHTRYTIYVHMACVLMSNYAFMCFSTHMHWI